MNTVAGLDLLYKDEKEGNLSELGLVSTCSSYAPNMQHEFIKEKLEGLDAEEGNELGSREGEGGENSVLQQERGGMRESELVLGFNLLIKALTAITKLPLSLIRAQGELTDKIL